MTDLVEAIKEGSAILVATDVFTELKRIATKENKTPDVFMGIKVIHDKHLPSGHIMTKRIEKSKEGITL